MKIADLRAGDVVMVMVSGHEVPGVVLAEGWHTTRRATGTNRVIGYKPTDAKSGHRGVLLLVADRFEIRMGDYDARSSRPTAAEVAAQLPDLWREVAAQLPQRPTRFPSWLTLELVEPRQVRALWADHVAERELRASHARDAEEARRRARAENDEARQRVVEVIGTPGLGLPDRSELWPSGEPSLPGSWVALERFANAYAAVQVALVLAENERNGVQR